MEDVTLLKKIPLFKDFKSTELASVSMVAHRERYKRDQVIFKEKDKGDALYIIKKGRVRIIKRDSFGEDHVLALLKPGEYFGEISLVDRAPRSATVVAHEDTECIAIKRGDFKNLIAGNTEIERKFYKSFSEVLCERLRVTNENLTFSQEINKLIQELD
jgi:CRP/FNR family cyclic AMP-dependent transcriptional regulator